MSVTGGERQLRQSVEVDDDGSMVLVQRPANVTSSSSDLAVMLPGGRYVKSLGSAGDIYAISRENLVKDDRLQSFSGTVLWGLTTAMKVESALYLLKRELCLYQEFDGACGGKSAAPVHLAPFVGSFAGGICISTKDNADGALIPSRHFPQ